MVDPCSWPVTRLVPAYYRRQDRIARPERTTRARARSTLSYHRHHVFAFFRHSWKLFIAFWFNGNTMNSRMTVGATVGTSAASTTYGTDDGFGGRIPEDKMFHMCCSLTIYVVSPSTFASSISYCLKTDRNTDLIPTQSPSLATNQHSKSFTRSS